MTKFVASGGLKNYQDDDNGGAHIFSGIPNRAYVICALAFGGFTWQKVGKIWWAVATTPNLLPGSCTFIQFADATVDMTLKIYNAADATTVRNAWNTVGVVRTV